MKKLGFSLPAAILSAAAAANNPTALPDVAPLAQGQHAAVNIPQQRLFLYQDGKLVKIYPVGVGKADTPTDLGRHLIGATAYNPTWYVPKSIQKKRNDGVKVVPPGPDNPLGGVFIRMGEPKLGLGIHATNTPSSVPGVVSAGCVRMKSPDAMEFARTIKRGTPVDVIYQLAALNSDSDQNLWLAAFRDPYKQKNLDTAALRKSIAEWAKANGKTVQAKRLEAVLKNRTGTLNCITCTAPAKVKGSLQSIEWTSGRGVLTGTEAVKTPATPAEPTETLPEGTAIEVDVGDTAPASTPASAPTGSNTLF
ncbi:L,D-transpeptidase [Neisseria leonii]|uniref:L,D-transpeptidase n=1 Tax=Neisseria leonii TaxID=2995413 RepID=UPI00237B525B|nr:L,D-transpeptidase [Neisseria sp. 3986]MDD9326552.1 L,D-transpeptidase [Neisseria sp. 3986]